MLRASLPEAQDFDSAGGLKPIRRWRAATAEDREQLGCWGWELQRGASRTPRPSEAAHGVRREPRGLAAVRSALRLSAPPAPEPTLATREKPSRPNSASLIRCLPKQGRLPDFTRPGTLSQPARLPRMQEDLTAVLSRD